MRTKPDFIIAGAARSGTTWVYELLKKHPMVFMATPRQPEPKFFSHADRYRLGFHWYYKTYFQKASPLKIWGEKSTAYLEFPEISAQRIRKNLPQVKLIFILRHPVDRTYSNYQWSKKNGWEKLSFEEAIRLERSRERAYKGRLKKIRPFSYLSRSRYDKLLRPFLKKFDTKQILMLRYENLKRNPKKFALQIHEFLEITPRPRDIQGLKPENKTGSYEKPLRGALRQKISRTLKASIRIWDNLKS